MLGVDRQTMAFELTFQVKPGLLSVVVVGEQTPAAVEDLLVKIKGLALKNARSRILVDYRQVEVGQLSNRERAAIGSHIAMTLGSDLRVAIIYSAPRINRFAEITASSLGALIHTVGSEEEGINWLYES